MPTFVKLSVESDLPATNQAKEFRCGDKEICVANVDGTLSAIDNICLHRGGPLGDGAILNGKVVCPWHGWEWDPKTGVHDTHTKVAVYPIKVENGDVLIEIDAAMP